ncbi:leucyl/phenylalanyl-tRNA--protein transferase [Segetibacter aerophilus]|uniref:Leucyl/phenylalanyl-tRNA--protein transferase n=1 Tax=Segetibacter aerophilus TaxID=670293 RepID=A0A512BH96_9BACT|nr:leucyl/phenylalanyl-tRNA--protein transferase [Segetibacter aerophilus]GEO11329.1 leucyl/phenylalanyl-tRNA--protein transferase [Segetibacter aerophilus]
MPLYVLDNNLWFPPVNEALQDGLLAIGGDLSEERLLLAYHKGIFPWFDGDVPMWWCPDPRFVLFPNELKVSKSMKALLKRNAFEFTIDKAFPAVIRACKEKEREGQDGTWITDNVEAAYVHLHKRGYAQSAEVWVNGELTGGLYGVRLGNMFFGESMFSHVSNASKYAFIKYIGHLIEEGVQLIDCQVYTEHLESLGARMIERDVFMEYVKGAR